MAGEWEGHRACCLRELGGRKIQIAVWASDSIWQYVGCLALPLYGARYLQAEVFTDPLHSQTQPGSQRVSLCLIPEWIQVDSLSALITWYNHQRRKWGQTEVRQRVWTAGKIEAFFAEARNKLQEKLLINWCWCSLSILYIVYVLSY